jgi:hypothetical protein
MAASSPSPSPTDILCLNVLQGSVIYPYNLLDYELNFFHHTIQQHIRVTLIPQQLANTSKIQASKEELRNAIVDVNDSNAILQSMNPNEAIHEKLLHSQCMLENVIKQFKSFSQ